MSAETLKTMRKLSKWASSESHKRKASFEFSELGVCVIRMKEIQPDGGHVAEKCIIDLSLSHISFGIALNREFDKLITQFEQRKETIVDHSRSS